MIGPVSGASDIVEVFITFPGIIFHATEGLFSNLNDRKSSDIASRVAIV